jgi:hypothetical protein
MPATGHQPTTTDLAFDRVLCVGDTHGNLAWWRNVVVEVASRLNVDAIVQVGDFGYWPGPLDGDLFIEQVKESPLPVLFLDGNHENHPALRADSGYPNRTPVLLGGNLWYLPRGARCQLAGTEALAMGGARSIDRDSRTPGKSWFWEEAVDEDDIAAAGQAEAGILLCHDAPSGWTIPGLAPDHELPLSWQLERPTCEEHRDRLREVVELVEPRILIHGHYHQAYSATSAERWGAMQIEGLSEDGSSGAFATLTASPDGPRVGRVTWRA